MNKKDKLITSEILQTINTSNRVLLHCHPDPDADSIGSVYAMTKYIESLGKNVTPILGDSPLPPNLLCLPDHDKIKSLSFSDISLDDYDLFIIMDSSSINRISAINEISFPSSLKTIIIDHHQTNSRFADINFVNPQYSSTCHMVYDLLVEAETNIDPTSALYLLVGIYQDSGGFIYSNTTPDTLEACFKLAQKYPDFHRYLFKINNTKTEIEIKVFGLALNSVETYLNHKVALSSLSNDLLATHHISKQEAANGFIGNELRSVNSWDIVGSLVELEPNKTTISLRTSKEDLYDVSLVANTLDPSGGGHKGAAGVTINQNANDTKQTLISTIEKLYPQLKLLRNNL